jgi:hypothetical protein
LNDHIVFVLVHSKRVNQTEVHHHATPEIHPANLRRSPAITCYLRNVTVELPSTMELPNKLLLSEGSGKKYLDYRGNKA